MDLLFLIFLFPQILSIVESSTMEEGPFSLIPDEILFPILLLLCPKDLMQMMCVCKRCKDIITSSSFKDEFWKKSSTKGMDSFLYMTIKEVENMSMNIAPIGSLDQKPMPCEQIPFPFPPMDYSLVGCINGIVCCTETNNFGKTLYFYNPCIRKQRVVHSSAITVAIENPEAFLGFGYHAEEDDCKVIRIWLDHQYTSPKSTIDSLESSDSSEIYVHFEVYSLKTNTWREINVEVFPISEIYSRPSISVNNSINWFAESNDEKVILSFDFRQETFRTMGLPDFGENVFLIIGEYLHEYLGELCVFKYVPGINWEAPSLNSFQLWVMKEYGVESSWTRIYNIQVNNKRLIFKPLLFTKCGKLVVKSRRSNVVLCNLENWEMKLSAIRDVDNAMAFANYNESLLLLLE